MNKILIKRKPCDNKCPLRIVMHRFGDKWSILIIQILSEENILRFGELLSKIDGISLKVFSSTLKMLEKYGFISRKVYPEVPPKVEYKLTKLGQDILPYIEKISTWAENNIKRKKE